MVKRVSLKFPYWVSKLFETVCLLTGDPLTPNATGTHSKSVTELRHHLNYFQKYRPMDEQNHSHNIHRTNKAVFVIAWFNTLRGLLPKQEVRCTAPSVMAK